LVVVWAFHEDCKLLTQFAILMLARTNGQRIGLSHPPDVVLRQSCFMLNEPASTKKVMFNGI